MSERKGTKALELWCKRLVRDCPSVHIDNMTTSWRDGIAFCALVHHFRPDLIDMSMLKAENIYENNQLAFSVAEKHLGIPALLDAEDMVENDVPDRLSILTYLSQFYQRLGHKVNTKVSENDSKSSLSPRVPEPTAPVSFGKTGLDKCTACSLPVYLAQRLLVSHKLYHRRCFRCSKCSGHLNPKNYHIISGSEFSCDSCKNEKTLSKFLNNNDHDQMGMLAFNDMSEKTIDKSNKEPISLKQKTRPQSIMDKINMFEKNIENVDNKVMNLTLKDNVNIRHSNEISSTSGEQIDMGSIKISPDDLSNTNPEDALCYVYNKPPEKEYKSNIDKFNFMQTQLSDNMENTVGSTDVSQTNHNENKFIAKDILNKVDIDKEESKDKDIPKIELTAESNITDDIRLAKSHNTAPNLTDSLYSPVSVTEHKNDDEIKISVPPRRKKQHAINVAASNKKKEEAAKPSIKLYPDNLNPFSDDDEEEPLEKVSTNPFGSSDEEDDKILPIPPSPKTVNDASTPVKRLITVNPFWSDGEEPSSDEESNDSSMNKSSLTTSTPNLPSSMRRTKAKAPPPPPPAAPPPIPYPAPSPAHTSTPAPLITVSEHPSTSMDDVASISSLSSYNSTIHSDQKSFGGATPLFKKKRLAPTPPDSLSTVSGYGGSLEKGIDSSGILSNTSASDCGSRRKGPAPGLPLPERREVKLQMSPQELQVQLDLLETQQLGLERQGVLIERMIRDKCEGDEGMTAPQEEVEDLVIQLCELVNEKNDLFRKQTELMYIRRQQRLEQEQADIEHEIRIIQSRPAVNRIDADKAREEQLVGRLVEIVRMRDELVQQLDTERRRERQEDLAIAASIANKRAQRNSESNSSSIKSLEVAATPKKNKVKDKVKKQLKKAKHSLIYKKKEDSDRKEDKPEKEKKTK